MIAMGIALGADRLVAVLPGGRQLESNDVANLRQTFTDLTKASGMARARVSVALMPPLIDLRRVTLPPLRPEERRRVLERDVARYFVGAREAQVVASDGAIAAAAPVQLIETIEAAVAESGWSLRAILPAHLCWAARLGDGNHAIRLSHATEVLRVLDGRLVDRGRIRPGESTDGVAMVDADPYVVAAAHATAVAPTLELCSAGRRTARRRATKRLSVTCVGAAALCLLLAAGVDYWGLQRELASLKERRHALAPTVAAAMQLRDSIAGATELTHTLERLDMTAPSWSSLFSDLADDLPRDAHIATFEARRDSLAITGVALEAGGVLQGLERIARLTRIHPDGPIRQDLTAAGVVREHFRFSAQLAQ